MSPPLSIRIGDISVAPATVLAPMEGITDAPFRALIRSLGGCGLVVTELVSAKELSLQTQRSLKQSSIATDTPPVAIQIYGRDPLLLGESARVCEAMGAQIIDINMGCPSRAVTRHRAGASLMREPKLATDIVRAVRQAVKIPVTVKMRLGWSQTTINAPELAAIFESEGIDGITVHGRTREQLFEGHADWAKIGEVKASVRIPVIGNGDIVRATDALEMIRVSGVDGVMIGRGIIRNPWLILQVSQALSGEEVFQPTLKQRHDHLMVYYEIVRTQLERPKLVLGRLKKVIGYFTEGLPLALSLRKQVFHSTSVDEAVDAIERFFEHAEMAAESRGEDWIFRDAPRS